jgi:superkiller protein 3
VLSTLPIPDHTNPAGTPAYQTQAAVHNTLPVLDEIIGIVEKDEEDAYSKEVAKRRTRLGAASPEQLRKEVGVEIWGPSQVRVRLSTHLQFTEPVSQLPKLYDDVLNHPNTPDDLRRATDAKLLRYKHRYLCALPPKGDLKATASREVETLVSGAIALGIPDELAWMLCLDGQNCIDGGLSFSFPPLPFFIQKNDRNLQSTSAPAVHGALPVFTPDVPAQGVFSVHGYSFGGSRRRRRYSQPTCRTNH